MTDFDPMRARVLQGVSDIEAVAKLHPELFDVKKRAIGVWRLLFITSAVVIALCVVKHYVWGTPEDPFDFILGMLAATTWVYFDPPAIRTIYTMKKRDGNGEGVA